MLWVRALTIMDTLPKEMVEKEKDEESLMMAIVKLSFKGESDYDDNFEFRYQVGIQQFCQKFASKGVHRREIKVLKALNYDLPKWTVADFLLINGIYTEHTVSFLISLCLLTSSVHQIISLYRLYNTCRKEKEKPLEEWDLFLQRTPSSPLETIFNFHRTLKLEPHGQYRCLVLLTERSQIYYN
jgi:hypothetical protein